jgi:hypothetical protein
VAQPDIATGGKGADGVPHGESKDFLHITRLGHGYAMRVIDNYANSCLVLKLSEMLSMNVRIKPSLHWLTTPRITLGNV